MAPKGDVTIVAKKVDISHVTERTEYESRQSTRQSGITVSLSNSIIDSAKTVEAMHDASRDTEDPRMKALAVAAGAMSISQAASTPKPSKDDPLSGTSVTASYGVNESSSASKQITERTTPSRVLAGGRASIVATGGDNSNINITGSDIEGEDIDLKADKDIILRAAIEHNERQSSNKSSSASAGLSLSFSSEGVGASVVGNANQSKGTGIGTDHLLRPINITAKKELNIQSGRDMTMEGAKAKGEKVTVDVARNLVISTPQERRDYESQQSSSGSAISIPIPGAGAGEAGASVSYGKEKIDSRFRSVDERSGIEAGDEGFAVAVQGKTKLTGAVIASTDQAVSEGRNRFNGITGKEEENNPPVEEKPAEKKEEQPADNAAEEKEPAAPDAPAREEREPATSEASRKEEQRHLNAAELELIDVVNQAEYRANAVAINAGVGSHLSSSGGGVGRASGAASSITRSGISGIAGDKGVRTGDKSSGITPIFDEEAVKKDIGAQVIITQEFSKQASKVIGDYAAGQLEEAAMLEEAAAKEPDPKKAKALREEAKAIKDLWAEGGTLRVALHTLVGGLTGNLAGAAGAGISQAIIPTLGEKLAELDLPAPLEQALIQAVALGIGAAAGGNAGAAAAESATTQNFLLHEEQEDLVDAIAACNDGNAEACARKAELEALDRSLRRTDAEILQYARENGLSITLVLEFEAGGNLFASNGCRAADPGRCSYFLFQFETGRFNTLKELFVDIKNIATYRRYRNDAQRADAEWVLEELRTEMRVPPGTSDEELVELIGREARAGSERFTRAARAIAADGRFIKLQDRFIRDRKFIVALTAPLNPAVNPPHMRDASPLRADVEQRSRTLTEAITSTATQMGQNGARDVMRKVGEKIEDRLLERGEITQAEFDRRRALGEERVFDHGLDNITDREMIDLVYETRMEEMERLAVIREGGGDQVTADEYRGIVENRLPDEQARAVELLEAEQRETAAAQQATEQAE